MIHSKYESSFPEKPRSNALRTCRTKLLKADCSISIANCLKNSLKRKNESTNLTVCFHEMFE